MFNSNRNSFFKFVILISLINRIYCESDEDRLIKEELVKYFQSTDGDEDHQLTVDELARWIRNIHDSIIEDNVEMQWANIDKEVIEEHTWQDYEVAKRETITWDNYRKRIYADHFEDRKIAGDKRSVEEIENEFDQIVTRFEKRWNLADEDGTGYLVKAEFKNYLHPEESKNETVMEGAVEDLREDLDRNKDGQVSFDEYLNHLRSIEDSDKVDSDFDEINKENFELHLDKNKNGLLDLDEIKSWVIPNYDKYKLEASSLMEQTDLNRDNELQLEELIEGFDKFYNLLPPKFYETLNDKHETVPTIKHDEF